MMTTKQLLSGAAVSVLVLLCAGPVQAGEIIGFTPFPGINSVAGVIINPAAPANNDDVAGASPNDLFVTQKDYVAIGAVDIVFDVVPTGGVTEYSIREGVSNSTGVDWSGYTIQLGFGTGADFVVSTPGDGLDFDTPDLNSPLDFTVFFSTAVVATEYEIVASGGVFPDGMFSLPYFRFSIDVPDGIGKFTLRQFPTAVPEPVSASLLTVLGLGSLTLRTRKQS
jgi:hypothetical protein